MSATCESEVIISFDGPEAACVTRWDRETKTFSVKFRDGFWASTPHKELHIIDGRTIHQANIDRLCARLREVAETGDMK